MPDSDIRPKITDLQIAQARDTLLTEQALSKATNNSAAIKALHKRLDEVVDCINDKPSTEEFTKMLDARDNATIALAIKKILYAVGAAVVAAITAAGIKFGGGS